MALSLGHLLKIFTAIAMYLLIYNNIQTIKDIKKIYICYFLSAIIPLLFGFYQYITKTAHAWESGPGGTRIDSVLGECNAYGEYLATLICVLCTAFFFKKLQYKKWPLAILSLAVLLSFLLSQNRGSWISLFVGIIIATILYKRHVHVTIIASVLTLVVLASSPIIIVRFMELTQKSEFGSHNTFQGRLQYHEKLLDLVKENPVVGYGLGTAGYTSKITYPPHNDYLRIALESGVPGMLLYIVFLLKELFDHIQRVRTTMFGLVHFSSLILIVYFIILSFFQNIIYNVTVFPMILGIFAISAKLHFLEKHQKISFSD
jgi:O-antigen ligase